MSDTRPEAGREDAPPVDATNARTYELHSVVVRYEGRPDRCTVYPRRDSCRERVTAWLSADFDAFVCLDAMR